MQGKLRLQWMQSSFYQHYTKNISDFTKYLYKHVLVFIYKTPSTWKCQAKNKFVKKMVLRLPWI